ncbi:hypothetical protein [Confluentibacter flavum]|uniref:Lipocalin-like domain-containing protein n=1 Tax=Confluentibacter flavum TaxID=1909700 RepID=A0A2N3HJQ0_9FLAO|nr:hypothetical protein [Confluentibacter flavum]PKQ45114.1 hypothetical protein CSW08_09470 [Confluentibacter flavum]
MKYYLIIACISFLTLTNCSLGDVDNSEPQVIRVLWHLKNVSGGVAGVDNDFNSGVIVWEFKDATSTLTVSNNNSNAAIEDGLNSGTYTYSIDDNSTGNDDYISIGPNEFGSIAITSNGNQLIIDQNKTSTGPAADGYIYTFDKSIIVEN